MIIKLIRKLLKIKDTEEIRQSCNGLTVEVEQVRERFVQETDETIKVLKKFNKEVKKKSVIGSIYLVVKE